MVAYNIANLLYNAMVVFMWTEHGDANLNKNYRHFLPNIQFHSYFNKRAFDFFDNFFIAYNP
jgi:hypothetical protein